MNQQRAGLGHTLWIENLFRPLVIGVMFGCIALSLVELVHLLVPAWNGTYLVAGCVLAAVEANYSYGLIRARALRGVDVLRFRVIELVLFFILLRIGGYLGDNWADVVADIQTWPHYPSKIIDLETAAAFVLAFLSWHVSTQTVRDLERLDESPAYHRDYVPPMESLADRFFWGGAVLLIAAGLTRIGIVQLLNLSRPPVPGLVLNVLVYFLLGLVMLGQVRFATLHKRWKAQGIKVADDLPRRWVRYSLALIGLAAFLAFLLPTGYTMGLLDTVGWILGTIMGIIWYIATLFVLLVTLPLTWLFWLLSKLLGEPAPAPQGSLSLPPLSQQPSGSVAPNWLEIFRSLLFWIVALGIVFYVVRSYLRDHPEVREALLALGLIRALRRWWMALWRQLGRWVQSASERIPRRFLSLQLARRKPSREPFRFFRLGALSPREQILYYYLSIVRRAGQQGFPRRPAQTPDEYRTTLEPNLPEAQEEMDLLTQAFVEVRYSRHEVEPDQARRVRASWEQVKAALNAIKRKIEGGG
jgi:hypothetical protein